MKFIFDCEMNYSDCPHVAQIFVGFRELEKKGVVRLFLKREKLPVNQSQALLRVVVNGRYNVIYDMLDGLNWIRGSVQENLNYFKANIKADFYFKRSFRRPIVDYVPEGCRAFPLGFNYYIESDDWFSGNAGIAVKNFLRKNKYISKFFNTGRNVAYASDFEFPPVLSRDRRILFLTRLWDPDEVELNFLKEERRYINENRIELVDACRKEFKDLFVGGILKDAFSIRRAPQYTAPKCLTDRGSFLKAVKQSAVCIATAGLHDSIGWKFGEYIAASRAIITEPLIDEVPGDFMQDKNYLVFLNKDELLREIDFLLTHDDFLLDMMKNNAVYYRDYLRPDRLVLNTLLQIQSYDPQDRTVNIYKGGIDGV